MECTFQKFHANKCPKVYSFSSNNYLGKNGNVGGVGVGNGDNVSVIETDGIGL